MLDNIDKIEHRIYIVEDELIVCLSRPLPHLQLAYVMVNK